MHGPRSLRSVSLRLPRVRGMALGLAVAALAAFSGEVFAQGKSKGREVEEKTITSNDGRWSLPITYYKSGKGKESPVVILLHQGRSSKLAWKNGFPERLQDEGYAVVAVDLRKHGLATYLPLGNERAPDKELVAADYGAMVTADLEAIKSFLFDENEKQALNVRKTAIIAPGMSAPIAANFAANDWLKTPYDDAPVFAARTPRGQDIRVLILMSPERRLPGMTSDKALQFLRRDDLNVAIFIPYGNRDRRADGRDYYKTLTTGSSDRPERFIEQAYNSNEHGTDMLGKTPKLEEHILGFLKKYLDGLNGPSDAWRSRKSRLAS